MDLTTFLVPDAPRGAIRFGIPRDWVVIPQEASYKLCDRQPPEEEATLEVTYIPLPDEDLSALPVGLVLRGMTLFDDRGIEAWRPELVDETRGDLEIAQLATRWFDPVPDREACSHIAFVRRRDIQALLTFDYWLADAERFRQVWFRVMETLRVAE